MPASIDSKPVFVRGVGEELCPIKQCFTHKSGTCETEKVLNTSEVFSKYKEDFSQPIKWSDNTEENLLELLKETKMTCKKQQ